MRNNKQVLVNNDPNHQRPRLRLDSGMRAKDVNEGVEWRPLNACVANSELASWKKSISKFAEALVCRYKMWRQFKREEHNPLIYLDAQAGLSNWSRIDSS